MSISVATPLWAYLSESPRSEPLDADAIVREIITNAGILADVTPSGDRFALVALPLHLLQALPTVVPAPARPLPLFERRA